MKKTINFIKWILSLLFVPFFIDRIYGVAEWYINRDEKKYLKAARFVEEYNIRHSLYPFEPGWEERERKENGK